VPSPANVHPAERLAEIVGAGTWGERLRRLAAQELIEKDPRLISSREEVVSFWCIKVFRKWGAPNWRGRNESEQGTFVVGSAENARNLVGHAVELGDGLSSAGDTNFIKSYNEARLDTVIPSVTPWATRKYDLVFRAIPFGPDP
jgi:hypothetical protein